MSRVQAVIDAVAEVSDIPKELLLGRRRTSRVAYARHLCMLILYETCPHLSLPDIGHILSRDHSTVRYGIAGAREMVTRCPTYREKADRVRAIVEKVPIDMRIEMEGDMPIYTRAAKALRIENAALKQRIRDLEAELGRT